MSGHLVDVPYQETDCDTASVLMKQLQYSSYLRTSAGTRNE